MVDVYHLEKDLVRPARRTARELRETGRSVAVNYMIFVIHMWIQS